GQVLRERLRLFGGGLELDGREVDGGHQAPQRVHRVVDRVGDRPGDVLGDGRLHGEVAVGQARELIEQAQDGLLVAVAFLALRIGREALPLDRAVHAQRRGERGGEQRQPGGEQRQRQVRECPRPSGRRGGGRLGGGQVARVRGDGARGALRRRQRR